MLEFSLAGRVLALKSTPSVVMTTLLNLSRENCWPVIQWTVSYCFFVSWWISEVFPTPASPITTTFECCIKRRRFLKSGWQNTLIVWVTPVFIPSSVSPHWLLESSTISSTASWERREGWVLATFTMNTNLELRLTQKTVTSTLLFPEYFIFRSISKYNVLTCPLH